MIRKPRKYTWRGYLSDCYCHNCVRGRKRYALRRPAFPVILFGAHTLRWGLARDEIVPAAYWRNVYWRNVYSYLNTEPQGRHGTYRTYIVHEDPT